MDEKYISVSHESARSAPERGRRVARPARRRGRSVLWGIYGFVVVLSAIIVAVYIGLSLWVKPPEQTQAPTPPAQTDARPMGGEADPDPGLPAERVLTRRKNVYTIFLAATDKEGYRTDTMMVACYDIPNQKVGIISIPRDTLTHREPGKNPKLVYGSGGVKQRVEDVSLMLGIPIDGYVKVNLNGFISLVDYLGGVDFYIPCDMDYDDPFQDLHIHFKEGQKHLSGQEAMEVARFRKNNADENGHSTGYSDVGRTQTQQKLLVALAKKLLSWGSLTKVNGFVEIFNQNVDTDLALNDMLYFASQAVNIQDISASVSTATLEGRGDGVYHKNTWCFELDPDKTVETVNALINPYEEEMTLEDMNLVKAEGYK